VRSATSAGSAHVCSCSPRVSAKRLIVRLATEPASERRESVTQPSKLAAQPVIKGVTHQRGKAGRIDRQVDGDLMRDRIALCFG
jgi:hypothetical protein